MTDSFRLPLETWGRRRMADAEAWADRSRLRGWAYEFLWFGLKQGWACLFGGLMLAMIVGTFLLWPEGAPVSRYDVLVVGAVLIQVGMLAFRLESREEARVILLFHIAGTIMELSRRPTGRGSIPRIPC